MDDLKALHTLIAKTPPQVLYTYTLAHLKELVQSRSRVSPRLPLTEFFKSLIPPQRLHCVRCHANYFEVENDYGSCEMDHDEDSMGEPYRSYNRDSEYELVWGCCGKEGDGMDLDPPESPCFKGRHTTDLDDACYREDATDDDDKLESCSSLGCQLRPNH